MEKPAFTKLMMDWLKNYLQKHYGQTYNIQTLIPTSDISKVPDSDLKKCIGNYSYCDFSPDILGILKHKTNKDMIELVFLNRSINPISLKEIGEMQCYCRLSNPKEAFLVSTKGLPQEINKLLIDKDISKDLLMYADNKFITVFTWIEDRNQIDPLSVYPLRPDKNNRSLDTKPL